MKNLLLIILLTMAACNPEDPTVYKSFDGQWHYEDTNGNIKGSFSIEGPIAYAGESVLYTSTIAIYSVQLTLDADGQPSRLVLSDVLNRNQIDFSFGTKTFKKLDGQATLIVDGTPKSGTTFVKVRR